MVIAGAGKIPVRMPALFAMIRHPERGVILYDTGYHTRFYEVTSRFPYSILKKFTPAEITEEGNADNRLKSVGVEPDEVKTIIIGHGHVDHIPGAADFPNAKIVIERREWEFMQKNPIRIFAKGYVKPLYENLPNEIETIDIEKDGVETGPFEKAVDLYGDASMILVPLEGHTAGQMGLLLGNAGGEKYLFIGDAAWISENYLDLKSPSMLARTILSSHAKFRKTLHLLNKFHGDYPNVRIVPSHCPDAYEKLKASGAVD